MAEIKDKIVTLEILKDVKDSIDATKIPTTRTINGKALSADISLTASDVGAESSGAVTIHNTATDAHSDIRDLITGLTTRLNALADSDDVTLDQMSELVAYIKSNKSLIEEITTNKVNVSDIIDNLNTNVSEKPLSAAQGVAIKSLIDSLDSNKLDSTALSEAIDTALAQAKASGAFDGTPGEAGEPGTSVTITSTIESDEDGAYNIVTFSNGESLRIKNGSKGNDGAPGASPVKGIDYNTDADKEEMVELVIAALPTWNGGNY